MIAKSVPIYEQETHVYYMRDGQEANIYSSDTTQITRLDKLCRESPDMWQMIEESPTGKRYICKDKTLISFRRKKISRELTEEQREAAATRLAEARAAKNEEENL